jgi:hypothetical protein
MFHNDETFAAGLDVHDNADRAYPPQAVMVAGRLACGSNTVN